MGGDSLAQATWTSPAEALLQRRRDSKGLWTTLKDWFPPGTHTVTDGDADPTQSYQYRVRVRKATGATAIGGAVTLPPL